MGKEGRKGRKDEKTRRRGGEEIECEGTLNNIERIKHGFSDGIEK